MKTRIATFGVRFALVLFVTGAVVAGAGGAPGPLPAAPGRCVEDPDALYRAPIGNSPRRGASQPLVTIVEFSDFQCPYCARGASTMDELLEAYADDLRVVFKQLPLQFHDRAQLAAEASLAAHSQGKFWEFHDLLFAQQDSLDREGLERMAGEAGLDMRRFRRALDRHSWADAVEADKQLAERLGVTGTPTFLVNGRKIVGAQGADKFKEVVDAEIAKAIDRIAAGTDREDLYDTIMAGASSRVRCLPETEAGSSPEAAQPPAAPPAPPADIVQVNVEPWNPVIGPATAPVTLVVFGEYLCPFCSRLESTLDALVAAYGDRIRIVHRSRVVHPTAGYAARAALAAAMIGGFERMHERLFADYEQLRGDGLRSDPYGVLERIAVEAGLDWARVREEMDGAEVTRRFEADAAEAERLGVTGVPTVYVNGRRMTGAREASEFGALIDEALGITVPTIP